jgi:hypothetical protein
VVRLSVPIFGVFIRSIVAAASLRFLEGNYFVKFLESLGFGFSVGRKRFEKWDNWLRSKVEICVSLEGSWTDSWLSSFF